MSKMCLLLCFLAVTSIARSDSLFQRADDLLPLNPLQGTDTLNGTIESIDPLSPLFSFTKRQQTCSTGVSCLSGCCSAGERCIPTNPGGPCCPGSSITCPSGQCCYNQQNCCAGQCCSDTTATCCGNLGCCTKSQNCCNGIACCDPRKTCCPGGCCEFTGGKCCGSGCCAEGEECCGNGSGCCKKGAFCGKDQVCSTSITRISISTSTSTSVTSSSSSSSRSQGSSQTLTSQSTPKVSTPKTTSTASKTSSECSLDKRLVTTGQCKPQCPLPTPMTSIVFSHVTHSTPIFPASVLAATTSLASVVLDNSRLLRNMCIGMQKLSDDKGPVQEVVLTRHRDKKINRSNRKAMCKQPNGRSICGKDPRPPLLIDGNETYIPNNLGPEVLDVWYLKTECDEFPFASSCEGGDTSTGSSYCLSAWENRWGSIKMNPWSSLATGERCRIIIDNSWDCGGASTIQGGAPVGSAKPARMRKRENLVSANYSSSDLYIDILGDSQHALGLDLGDLDPGNYSVGLNIEKGEFQEFYVLDGSGDFIDYTASVSPKQDSLVFGVTDTVEDAFLVARTTETDVQMSYVLTNATQQSEDQKNAAAKDVLYQSWMMNWCLALILISWVTISP